jgi:hypothetical protein
VIALHHSILTEGPFGMGLHYIERHTLLPTLMTAEVISLILNGVFGGYRTYRKRHMTVCSCTMAIVMALLHSYSIINAIRREE